MSQMWSLSINIRIFFLWVLSLLTFYNLSAEDIRVSKFKISDNDKIFLEAFFRTLIHLENFSYVLLNEKPIGFTSITLKPDIHPKFLEHGCFSNIKISFILINGLKVWTKYQKYFENIIFFKSKDEKRLYFINKKVLLKIIKDNFFCLQQEINENVSANYILSIICDPEKEEKLLWQSDQILGILLGYGSQNALAYEYEKYLEEQLKNPLFFPELSKTKDLLEYFTFFPPNPIIFSDVQKKKWFPKSVTLSEAWQNHQKQFNGYFPTKDYELHKGITITAPIGFRMLKTKDTINDNKKLIHGYQKLKEKAALILNRGDFLDVILKEMQKI